MPSAMLKVPSILGPACPPSGASSMASKNAVAPKLVSARCRLSGALKSLFKLMSS